MLRAYYALFGRLSPGQLLDSERARLALLLVLASAYLYLLLFVPRFIPINVGVGDDRLFLGEAGRIIDGQAIYRDFFELYLPGVDLFYALLFRIFGVRAWIPNVCVLGIGIGFFWTSIVLSRRLLDGASAFLPGLMFLSISYRSYLDASPHWFSTLLIMIATAVLIEERSSMRLTIAGMLTGLATCFAQSHGAFAAAGVAAFLLWEGTRDCDGWRNVSRRELCFLIPFGSVLALCVGYAICAAGFQPFFFSTILFLFKYWTYLGSNSWRAYAAFEIGSQVQQLQWPGFRPLLQVLLVPGIYLVAIVVYLRQATTSPSKQWRCIILLSAVGLAMFGSVANSAVHWRVATVSLPAYLIVVWLFERKLGVKGMLAVWALTLGFMAKDIQVLQTSWTTLLEPPAGRVALTRNDPVSFYQWLAANTHPGEYVFETSGWDIYFWFELRNPTELQRWYATEFTTPVQLNTSLRDLEQRKPRLIVWGGDLVWPVNDYLDPGRNYIRSHYRKIENFDDNIGGQISVWERTDSH